MAEENSLQAWTEQVDRLWLEGQHNEAIRRMLERINREAAPIQRQLVMRLVDYVLALGDEQGAAHLLRKLLHLHPHDHQIENRLAGLMQRDQALADVPHPHPAVLRAWVGSALSEPASPAMPAHVTGLVINLDAALERWQRMAQQIESLGWEATHRRFPALEASLEEARTLGLRSAGELGLWRSTRALLADWLSGDPGPEAVLHVLEDDAILNPALPKLLGPFRACEPRLHILFSECFLTRDLYERFRALEQQRQRDGHSLLLVRGEQYLACASSYLLNRQGAERCHELMQVMEQQGRLLPIDLFYRKLIQQGLLHAALPLPFLSTIAPVRDSAIQTGLSANISLAKSADLAMRRLLYLQSWDPGEVASVLQETAELLSHALNPDQQEQLLLTMLSHGRERGWLANY